MNWRRIGIIAALAATFAAGAKAGVKYAQSVYVSKDRKYIEGEVVDKEK